MDAQLVRTLFDYREDGVLLWKVRPSHGVYPGDVAGGFYNTGYRYVQYAGTVYKCADLIWLWHTGEPVPKGKELDHKDRVRSNDRIGNLEPKTRSQNLRNTAPRNKLGVKNVEYVKGKYRAHAWRQGEGKIHLGIFETLDEAIAARDNYEAPSDR